MPHSTASPRRLFDQRLVLGLVLGDLAACALAVPAAWALRSAIAEPLLAPLKHDLWLYLRALPIVAALWLVAFHSLGLYAPRRFISPLAETTAVLRAVTLATLLIAAASFLSHRDYSRAMLFLFWGSGLVLELFVRSALRRARARTRATARAVVVGTGDLARLVAERIREQAQYGYELVGLVGEGQGFAEYPVLGETARLREVISQQHVDEVLVAQPDLGPGDLMPLIESCEGLGVEFRLVAGPLEVLTQDAELSGMADLPVLDLPTQRFAPWQRVVKRGADVVLAAVLLVLFTPLMLLIALLVRRETRASAVFRQTRIGYHGRPFTMLKFCTMRPEADPYAESPTAPEDERVTRTGRWLRRWSLDELPQLVNILRGEMSLVGPRPEMPFLVDQYEPWQRRRLDVKPGLTGLWQILGRKDLPLRDSIEYDFYYIRNWSIWLDLSIILRTARVVMGGKGAY